MIHLTVQVLLQVFHLPQAGVDQEADQDRMLKEIVFRDPEDTQDLIPGVDQDHTITDTRKDTILDITEDILTSKILITEQISY